MSIQFIHTETNWNSVTLLIMLCTWLLSPRKEIHRSNTAEKRHLTFISKKESYPVLRPELDLVHYACSWWIRECGIFDIDLTVTVKVIVRSQYRLTVFCFRCSLGQMIQEYIQSLHCPCAWLKAGIMTHYSNANNLAVTTGNNESTTITNQVDGPSSAVRRSVLWLGPSAD